jgi:hypothetical protein
MIKPVLKYSLIDIYNNRKQVTFGRWPFALQAVCRKYGAAKFEYYAGGNWHVSSGLLQNTAYRVRGEYNPTPFKVFVEQTLRFSDTVILKSEIRQLPTPVSPEPRKHKLSYPQILFNGPATIVMWKEGVKTFVKCTEDDWKEGKCDRKQGYMMNWLMHDASLTKTQLHKLLAWIKPELVYAWLFQRYVKGTGFTENQAKQELLRIERGSKKDKAAEMKAALRAIKMERLSEL